MESDFFIHFCRTCRWVGRRPPKVWGDGTHSTPGGQATYCSGEISVINVDEPVGITIETTLTAGHLSKHTTITVPSDADLHDVLNECWLSTVKEIPADEGSEGLDDESAD